MSSELFEPTLESSDRADTFDRPWRPWTLVFATFFGGIAAGAIVLTLNWKRLGSPERTLPTAIAMGLAVIIIGVGVGYASTDYMDNPEVRRNWRLGVRIVSVAISSVVAALQVKRYQVAERSGVETGSALVPVLLATASGFAIHFVLAMIGRQLGLAT